MTTSQVFYIHFFNFLCVIIVFINENLLSCSIIALLATKLGFRPKFHSTKLLLPLVHIQLFDLWRLTPRSIWLNRNLIHHMVQLGTALWEQALVHMSRIRSEASCIFQSIRFTSFFSKLQLSLWTIDNVHNKYELKSLSVWLSLQI